MKLGKQSTAGLALALFIAASLPAYAGVGLPHIGKKKHQEDVLPARKLTAS